MKTDAAAQKTKSPELRPLPTASEQAAAFAKLSQKDRDNFERQITNATTKGGEPLANMWRRLAGAAMGLATKPPKLSGVNTIQFFIPDGNYRKQVYALHLSDTATITLFLPDILADVVKAKIVTPLPKDPTPHTYAVGKGAEKLLIEPFDRDSVNPQFYFKDMTGWNRKAIGVVLTPTATEAQIHVAEQMMVLAATWPAPVAEPAK